MLSWRPAAPKVDPGLGRRVLVEAKQSCTVALQGGLVLDEHLPRTPSKTGPLPRGAPATCSAEIGESPAGAIPRRKCTEFRPQKKRRRETSRPSALQRSRVRNEKLFRTPSKMGPFLRYLQRGQSGNRRIPRWRHTASKVPRVSSPKDAATRDELSEGFAA